MRFGTGWAIAPLISVMLACSGWAVGTASAADLEFAHGLYRQGRYQLAADEYESFLKANSTGSMAIEARFFLAESFLQLGQPKKAQALYEYVRDQGKASSLARAAGLRAARSAALSGDRTGAIAQTREWLRQSAGDPLAPEASLLLGELLLENARAISSFTLPSGWPLVAGRKRSARGEGSEANASASEAEKVLRDGLKLAPASMKEAFQYSLALALSQTDQTDEAVQLLKGLATTRSSPLAADSLAALGTLLLERGDSKGALKAYEQLRRDHPASTQRGPALLGEAAALETLGQAEASAATLQKLVDDEHIAPEVRADGWLRLGSLYLKMHRPADADKAFRAGAARLPPLVKKQELLLAAAMADLNQGNASRAEKTIRELLAHNLTADQTIRCRQLLLQAQLGQHDTSGAWKTMEEIQRASTKESDVAASAIAFARALAADPKAPARREGIERLRSLVREPSARRSLDYFAATVAYGQGNDAAAIGYLRDVITDSSDARRSADARLLLGMALARAGQLAEAVAPLEALLADPVVGAAAHRQLAIIVAKMEPTAEQKAIQARLVQRAEKQPNRSTLLLELAEALLDQKRIAAARPLFARAQELAATTSERARAKIGLGWTFFEEDQFVPARAEFQVVLTMEGAASDQRAEALYLFGISEERLGNLDAAVAALTRCVSEYSKSASASDAGRRAAACLTSQGRVKEALALRERLRALPGGNDDARVLSEMAYSAWRAGHLAESRQCFERLLQEHPSGAPARDGAIQLATLRLAEREFTSAIDQLDRLEQLGAEEQWPSLCLLRGRCRLELGQFAEAEKDWRAVREKFPDDPRAKEAEYWFGESAARQGRWAESVKFLRGYLASSKATYEAAAKIRLAEALMVAGDTAAALAAAQSLPDRLSDPRARREASLVLGRVLQRMADFDRSRVAYERAIGPERDDIAARAQLQIGETYRLQKNLREALKAFLKVDVLYPQADIRSVSLLYAAECHEQLGERELAIQTYKSCIERQQQGTAARSAADRLRSLAAR